LPCAGVLGIDVAWAQVARRSHPAHPIEINGRACELVRRRRH
jgi:hypothetical protein